uniref:Uncharacterized protein n=1 Tax=Candidatus Kentrum sp. LPFa TaxID=2126335 RepID=A0A450W1P2_9GAMM|nr:MAG: hypothetical protein BECKLPF1236B_GA0070989_101726 [Candidatus Kentron sp. LPFa]
MRVAIHPTAPNRGCCFIVTRSQAETKDFRLLLLCHSCGSGNPVINISLIFLAASLALDTDILCRDDGRGFTKTKISLIVLPKILRLTD